MEAVKWQTYLRICFISALMAAALTIIFNLLGLTKESSYAEIAVKQVSISDSIFVTIFIYCLVSPVIEEVIFRHLIYNFIHRAFSRDHSIPVYKLGLSKAQVISICMTSMLFGIYHLNPVQGTYAFIMSLYITYCYARYHNLSVPVAAHCAANAVGLLFSLSAKL